MRAIIISISFYDFCRFGKKTSSRQHILFIAIAFGEVLSTSPADLRITITRQVISVQPDAERVSHRRYPSTIAAF